MRSSPSIARTARRGSAAKRVMWPRIGASAVQGKAGPHAIWRGRRASCIWCAQRRRVARRAFHPMCGIAGLILSSGAPPPDPATLSKLIDSAASPRPGRHRPRGGRPRRAGAQPAVDHRSGDRRPAAVRRSRLAGLQRRDLQLPRIARGDAGGELRHQQRLRAAAASVAARGRRLRAASARHVRDRHP